MRTVGAAARPGWLDAAEVAAANHRSSWISTPLPEQGGRPSQVCKSYADDRALTLFLLIAGLFFKPRTTEAGFGPWDHCLAFVLLQLACSIVLRLIR